jgi:battenin
VCDSDVGEVVTRRFTLSAWSSGTGGAGVLGAVAYLGLTEWIGLSSKISLLAVSPLPVLIAVR